MACTPTLHGPWDLSPVFVLRLPSILGPQIGGPTHTASVYKSLEPVSQKILSPLMILSKEIKTMVTMVISELKSISRLKIFRETGPWSLRPSSI